MIGQCFQFEYYGVLAPIVLAIIIGIVLINVWLRQKPHFQGRILFIACSWAMACWLLSVLAEVQSPTLDCKVLWAYAAWPAIAFLPSCWALFLRHYTLNIRRPLNRTEIAYLVAGPAAISAMAFSNPLHGLFYGSNTRLVEISDHTAAIYDHGPLFYISVAYLYMLMIAAISVVVIGIRRARKTHQSYFLFLLLLSAVPLMTNAAYLIFRFTVAGQDPTPFAFAVVLGIISWMLYTNRLFDIKAIARDLLYFDFDNPVIVVNAEGAVIGANPRARQLFRIRERGMGVRIDELPHLEDFAEIARKAASDQLPKDVTVDTRFLTVKVTPIDRPFADEAAPMGFVILLTDMTDLRAINLRLEAALSDNQKRLQEISVLRDDLERQLTIDPLTGVQNRRGIEQAFDNLCAQSTSGGECLVMALLDIDHFKKINDEFGHAVGDRVLKDFSRLLRARINAEWPIYRVGGEEFVIFFPHARVDKIAELVDRFRDDLQQNAFTRLSDPVPLNFSAGLAEATTEGETFTEVFKTADERLYFAKMDGRGKTVYEEQAKSRNVQGSA